MTGNLEPWSNGSALCFYWYQQIVLVWPSPKMSTHRLPHMNFVCNFLYLFLSVPVLLYRLSWPL